MVAISFSIEKLIYRILSGVKITTIRQLNNKWKPVLEKFNESKKITLQHYYKQRSKFSFKIIETGLKNIEIYNLSNMTQQDAIIDGGDTKEELLEFFKMAYGENYLEKEYVRIWWSAPNGKVTKPNATKIDWFDSKQEKLYTINPLVLNKKDCFNCFYKCIYCYAKNMYIRFKNNGKFKPGFYEGRLKGLKDAADNVFISSITDLFHECIPNSLISYIIEKSNEYNENNCNLYFLTKNPLRYQTFLNYFDKGTTWLGATIETDSYKSQPNQVSAAPAPEKRIVHFKNVDYPNKFVSIEPILRFNKSFIKNILEINPRLIFIGANSDIHSRNILKEPKREDILEAIEIFKENGINVVKKENLKRLIAKKVDGKIDYYI